MILFIAFVYSKQIEKQQVDGFQSWKEAPYCRLKVTFDKELVERKPVGLKHKVKLLGVKGPHNFFTITCIAEGERYFMSKCGYKENGNCVVTNTSIMLPFFPYALYAELCFSAFHWSCIRNINSWKSLSWPNWVLSVHETLKLTTYLLCISSLFIHPLTSSF